MNVLVRGLKLKVEIPITFLKPDFIEIEPNSDKGVVSQAGFPVENWSKEKIDKISNWMLNRENFYSANKPFALSNALILLAGHTIESKFNRPERLKYNTFGNECGEISDKKDFDRLINFLIEGDNKSRLDENYLNEVEKITHSMRMDICGLLEIDAVAESLNMIVDKIKESNEDEKGVIRLDGGEFNELLNRIEKKLQSVSIKHLIDKYT